MPWEGSNIPCRMRPPKGKHFSLWPHTGLGESMGSSSNDWLFKSVEVTKGPSPRRGDQTFVASHAIWQPGVVSGWAQEPSWTRMWLRYCHQKCLGSCNGHVVTEDANFPGRWERGSQQLSLLVGQLSVKFKLSQNEKMNGKEITEFQAIKSLGSHSFSGKEEVAGWKAPAWTHLWPICSRWCN